MKGNPLVECVPNFSEGRDRSIIVALETAAASVPGASLLDTSTDVDHNRTVLTIAGAPEPLAEAVFRAVAVAVERISLSNHEGVHPRVGAADVVPFVPVEDASLFDCAEIAVRVGERLWNELSLPVFLYEAAARSPARTRLEIIRSPSFRGEPDFGLGRHPTAGAAIVGARRFLIAWNVNLESTDVIAARTIARAIRESSGGLPCVKALGLPLSSRGRVQVSINLTDFSTTPLCLVFKKVQEEAHKLGTHVSGSELIGLIPKAALEASAECDFQWEMPSPIDDYVLETRLAKLRR